MSDDLEVDGLRRYQVSLAIDFWATDEDHAREQMTNLLEDGGGYWFDVEEVEGDA